MITIRALLNRIRWDRKYGRGEFIIGYFDRLEERIIVVPLVEVRFDPDDHFSFQLNGRDQEIFKERDRKLEEARELRKQKRQQAYSEIKHSGEAGIPLDQAA